MYKIFIRADNENLEKALKYIYGVGKLCIFEDLKQYEYGSSDAFALNKALHQYTLKNVMGHLDMRVALKMDLITAIKDLEKLSRFTSKNMIGEEQVVTTTVDGDNVLFLAHQYSSAISKAPTAEFRKVMPARPEAYRFVSSPSSISIPAVELLSFITTTKNKVFPKMDGDLLYIDGVYEGGAGEHKGLVALALTYRGNVDGKVEATTESGKLTYGGSIASEFCIMAVFDGSYTSGKNEIAFPENINWYKLIKGAKSGGKHMCSVGGSIQLKTIENMSVLTGAPEKLDIYAAPSHDPESMLSKNFAVFEKSKSIDDDGAGVHVKCDPTLFQSVLTTVSGKDAYVGFSKDTPDLILFTDAKTNGVVMGTSLVEKKAEEPAFEATPESKEPKDISETPGLPTAPSEAEEIEEVNEPEASDEELISVPVITSASLAGGTYNLYAGGKLLALLPKSVLEGDEIKRLQPIFRVPEGEKTLLEQVMDAITKVGDRAITRAELMEFLPPDTNIDSAGSALSSLYRKGKLEKPKKGYYKLIKTDE